MNISRPKAERLADCPARSPLSVRAPSAPRDVRSGHDLAALQDEAGVDLSLLQANLALTVEQRLLALEEGVRFAESVRTVDAS